MNEPQAGARSISWRSITALWCVGGVFEASQAVLIMRFAVNKRHAWLPLFATELATWLPWVLVTPWIISLARRYPIIRGTTVQTVAVHLAAFATISMVAEVWSATLQVLFNP
jgi:two-component system, LytTR family, sensor kinase